MAFNYYPPGLSIPKKARMNSHNFSPLNSLKIESSYFAPWLQYVSPCGDFLRQRLSNHVSHDAELSNWELNKLKAGRKLCIAFSVPT